MDDKKVMIAIAIAVTFALAFGAAMVFAQQAVTTPDGKVCDIPTFGNAGRYGPENYLGVDYDDCSLPGLDHLIKLTVEPPSGCPVADPLPECSRLVVGPGLPTYPCIQYGPE